MVISDPGNTAEWQKLVVEAAEAAGAHLDEELESYLVFTLMRYLRRADMVQRMLALDFLQAFESGRQSRGESLRDVGDQCLLVSGLFPKRAERRRVRISYYVDLGRAAYHNLANSLSHVSELYTHLADEFVSVMDTLQAIRLVANQPADIGGLAAYELWSDTGSRFAKKMVVEDRHDIHLMMGKQGKIH